MRMKDEKDYRESAQKHIEEAKAEWTIFGKTGIFILAVLGVIAFLALAWFVSNTSVTSLSGSISARNDMPYRLASVGERLEMEKKHLLSSTDNGTWGETELSSGNQQSYNSYIDNASGKTVETKQVYYMQEGEFAWRFQESIHFYPGARGKFEFYLIPQVSGLTTVQLQLEVLPYKNEDRGGKLGAVPITDETLVNLLKGHLLLFTALDDNTGYSGWIGVEHTITVGKEGTYLTKDMPYKVTVYWIWPKQYRNLIYDKYTTRGDLFGSTENNTDYNNLIDYINANKNNFFYPKDSCNDLTTSNQMTQAEFDRGVIAYNAADEYIGTRVDYLYLSVNTE